MTPSIAFRRLSPALALAACAALVPAAIHAQDGKPGAPRSEWLTWGGTIEREGWNRAERTLSKATVGRLEVKWKTQIDKTVPLDIESGASMLTAPLVAHGVGTPKGPRSLVYTLAASNTLAALDTATGSVVWRTTFENAVAPVNVANWVCTNTATATPVIDKAHGVLYAIASDGRLHGVDIATGRQKMAPLDFVPPYSRNWSLNLVDGVLYTTVGRGCGNPPGAPAPAPAAATGVSAADAAAGEPGAAARPRRVAVASHMIALDLNDPARKITRFFTNPSRPGGAWSRAGMAWGFGSFFALTADGEWDPAKGLWAQSLVRLRPRTLELMDYFTPSSLDEINAKDLDYASGGAVAFTYQGRDLVLSAGKDGTVFLHDARSLGGADHRTPLVAIKAGNDEMMYASTGVWGAPATFVNARNERWVYIPMWGPPSTQATFERTNGDAPHGSIMAFQIVLQDGKPTIVPKWVSRDLAVPDSPVIANGVVYAISTGENTLQRHTDPRYQTIYKGPDGKAPPKTGVLTAEERGQNVTHTTLYAFDAETGRELYSSGDAIDDWTHLSSITVVGGHVYVTTRKSYVYAFGLKAK
ncbi:MAG: PQQ-binding-like beta-propeller repeat protein [Acidobacteriota bacterium]